MLDKLANILGYQVVWGPTFEKVGNNFVFEDGTIIEASGTRLWSMGANQEIVEWGSGE